MSDLTPGGADHNELFSEVGWLQVFEGQNMPIKGYHPLADTQSEADIADYMASVRDVIRTCVDVMPSHDDYLARHCAVRKRWIAALSQQTAASCSRLFFGSRSKVSKA